jgi:hypothetical protein
MNVTTKMCDSMIPNRHRGLPPGGNHDGHTSMGKQSVETSSPDTYGAERRLGDFGSEEGRKRIYLLRVIQYALAFGAFRSWEPPRNGSRPVSKLTSSGLVVGRYSIKKRV